MNNEQKQMGVIYEQVVAACKAANEYSTLYIQKTFGIGYARAAALHDMLVDNGIVVVDEARASLKRGAEDPLFDEAIAACRKFNDFTVARIQTELSIGYVRAEQILAAYHE